MVATTHCHVATDFAPQNGAAESRPLAIADGLSRNMRKDRVGLKTLPAFAGRLGYLSRRRLEAQVLLPPRHYDESRIAMHKAAPSCVDVFLVRENGRPIDAKFTLARPSRMRRSMRGSNKIARRDWPASLRNAD